MSLGITQEEFSVAFVKLLTFIHTYGYGVRLGEAWRPPEMAAIYAQRGSGIANSVHTQKLAVDLNITKNGVLLTDSADYASFGAYWKTLHPLARWGGDFEHRKDGDHFSFEWEGVK